MQTKRINALKTRHDFAAVHKYGAQKGEEFEVEEVKNQKGTE